MSHPWQHRVARASRRRFLVGAAAALTTPWIVPASALGRNGHLPPSERITIGMLGVGNRGSSSLRGHAAAARSSGPGHRRLPPRSSGTGSSNWSRSSTPIEQGTEKFQGCDIYNDFRELLARDDIDAVWGCVPDHWHGVVYSQAIRGRQGHVRREAHHRAGSSRASGSAMPCDATAASSRRERSNAVRLIFGTPANWPSTATSAKCITVAWRRPGGEDLSGGTSVRAPPRDSTTTCGPDRRPASHSIPSDVNGSRCT